MKTKTCRQCDKPFLVVEPGDRDENLERGPVYLASSSEVCLSCHRKNGTVTGALNALLSRHPSGAGDQDDESGGVKH